MQAVNSTDCLQDYNSVRDLSELLVDQLTSTCTETFISISQLIFCIKCQIAHFCWSIATRRGCLPLCTCKGKCAFDTILKIKKLFETNCWYFRGGDIFYQNEESNSLWLFSAGYPIMHGSTELALKSTFVYATQFPDWILDDAFKPPVS